VTGEPLYRAIYQDSTLREPTSVIAAWIDGDRPLRAVIWSRLDDSWIYAPAIAAARMYDDQYRDTITPIDRATAEQIARDHLGTTLPSEEALVRIRDEGERSGLAWGPRRS